MTTPEESNRTAQSLSPTTTAQQDIVTSRQSRINMIWEITQAVIAVLITASVIYTQINKIDSPVLTNAFFLVIGFYYSRTNHQAIGGIGAKANENQDYQGR